MPKLSVIILSFNTKDITIQCLKSVFEKLHDNYEVIIIDNNSTDGSGSAISEFIKDKYNFHLIINSRNLGFTKGNNQAVRQAKGKYILFLNSDVIINKINSNDLLDIFETDKKIAVLTVKVILSDGQVDPASHRGFPTIWNSFCYYSGLEKIFAKAFFLNKLFGGYHLTWLNLDKTHEIDSPNGAFYLIRRDVFERLEGFDENFFMYGEDLDLSFRVKKLGWKILYYPYFKVTHLKYSSGLHKNDELTKLKTRDHFYNAMKTFYKKHYESRFPYIFNRLVYFLIDFKNRFS